MHPQTYRSLANARDFMRDAYRRPISLPDISARANLSPYHFLRVHKVTFGETPHEFLTRLRIEKAKALLSGGSHNVTEACFEVGFSSLGSFSILFNHRVGLSPSEYRRHARSSVAVPRTVRPLFVPGCFFRRVLQASRGRITATFEKRIARPVLSSRRSHDTGRSAVIQRQSHSTIYVIDQEEALGFYRDNLGFEVRTDMLVTEEGSVRWLTLSPKAQPDLEIVLMPIIPGPVFDAEAAEQMKALVRSGAIGIGVFETDDVRGDYERLSRLGVEFVSPPEERFYGTEAIVKDNSGNWFSLTQRKG